MNILEIKARKGNYNHVTNEKATKIPKPNVSHGVKKLIQFHNRKKL